MFCGSVMGNFSDSSVALGHGAVFKEDSDSGRLSPQEEAELCWRLAGILEQGLARPCSPPEWLSVLEEQLVQRGALGWQQREGPEARERCLDLFLRLAELQDPVADWVVKACHEGIAGVIGALPGLEALSETDLGLLIERVSRLPVASEQRQAFEASLLRARFSLELLQQGREAGGRQPDDGLEVLEAEWLNEGEGPEVVAPLRLVAAERDHADGHEVFSLEPFLDGDRAGAERALEEFLQRWQEDERPACPPVATLLDSLAGGEGPPTLEALAVLRQAASRWQDTFGARVMPLPPVDWRAEGLLVELDPLELAVLHLAAGSSAALEDILAELRRRHHDQDFWAAPAADPFPVLPDALEALRAFALRAGFYATTHAPLESFNRWAQPALQALLQAQVWSTEAGTQALWVPVGPGAATVRSWRGRCAAPTASKGDPAGPPGGWRSCWWGMGRMRSRGLTGRGRCLLEEPFGLRCVAGPESLHPARPAAGFEHSLEGLTCP